MLDKKADPKDNTLYNYIYMKSAQNVSLLERKGGLGLPGAGVGMGVNSVWAPDTSYSAEGTVQNCGAGASSGLVN